jgi:hypothetical protein
MEDTVGDIAAITEPVAVTDPVAGPDPGAWDPVEIPVPTYVTKPAAPRRTVRTIDLESTGVWTSGRTETDARLARAADEAGKATRSGRDAEQARAVGS